MPASDKPFPISAADDVWHQNKAQIRDLYQNQRKTLKEVKHLMEAKGFPVRPLSTWETKTRDVLQLRKKAKSTNWPLIYQHVLPRLETPGQKQLRRETAIYLNNSEIPWNKAWKEIRRSGAIALPLPRNAPSPLPHGITIRTPSPIQDLSTVITRDSQLTSEVLPKHFEHTEGFTPISQSKTALTAQVRSVDNASGSLARYAVSVYQDCAATIPWVDLYRALQCLFQGTFQAWQLDDDLFQEKHDFLSAIITHRIKRVDIYELNRDSQFCFDLLPNGFPVPPHPSHDLGCRVAISATRLQLNQFISTAMYLLSNNLHDPKDGDKGLEVFCSILERDPHQTIKLLHLRLPSIRIAWRPLLWYSSSSRRRDTFRLLVDIGIRNKWLTSQSVDGDLQSCAVKMNCKDTLMDLMAYGRSFGSGWWTQRFTATIAAIRNGNDECAQLLLEHCEFRAWTRWALREDQVMVIMFREFINEIDMQINGDMRALDVYLEIGANVDEPLRWAGMESSIKRYYGNEINDDLRLTILDYVFYFNRPLYEKLAPYSNVSPSTMSRTGILLALKGGTLALQNYLAARVVATPSSNWKYVQAYLELILAEQFMLQAEEIVVSSMWYWCSGTTRSYREIDLDTVRGLIRYGVDLTLSSINVGIQDLLDAVLRQLSRHCTDDGLELVAILVANGARIRRLHLRNAVEDHGFNTLECLALIVEDFPAKSVLALAEAARLNNFEAVKFLLHAGVDPSSFVPGGDLEDEYMQGSSYSVQAIATGYVERGKSSTCDMVKLLAEHGARLVVSPNDSSPFDFTSYLLRYSCSDTFRKVKHVIQIMRERQVFSVLPPSLLELCAGPPSITSGRVSRGEEWKGRLELFEYLLSQGAPVNPGSCLAALICAGGPEELIEKVVRSGADLNAYYQPQSHLEKCTPLQAAARDGNEHLVRLLLGAGSNVNSRACGRSSQTALQAICSWDTATEQEYERKMRICQLLIRHGADTNAAPARIGGWTALQFAAIAGHIEIAALLLRNGALVNAPPPCWKRAFIALDCAVRSRRLDMVKFLLNANALSSFRGTTGYDGAIELVDDLGPGNSVIADLLREHAANNMALGLINPEVLKPQEDYHIYGYITDEEYKIESYNPGYGTPGFLREDCTMDSLCRYCKGIAPD